MASARGSFAAINAIKQHDAHEEPWPQNANAMFRTAHTYLYSLPVLQHFLWLECDMIPTKTGWADMLESEYRRCGKPFMGAYYVHPFAHINGGMVYPANFANLNPAMVHATQRPFDLMRHEIVLNRAHRTDLIVRSLANPRSNTAHTFPTQESISIVPEGCVLFHGCKDGTLIQRLREKRNGGTQQQQTPYVHAPRNPISVVLPNPSMPLAMPGITLWGASWSEDKALQDMTVRMLRYCAKILKPDRILMFSYMPLPPGEYPFEKVQIPKLDWQRWSLFVNREAPKYFKTEFAMSVHEDGFPIDLSCWNPEFLKYDYIGAPWVDGIVGNGGFNIESAKLLKTKLAMPTTKDEQTTASDMYLCRQCAAYLKKKGIKFAPRDLALTFSTELFGNQWPSFGYHGRVSAAPKYQYGWSLIQNSEIAKS